MSIQWTTSEIYLDANATTPVLPLAQAAAATVLAEDFGNPSSAHGGGLRAADRLAAARRAAVRVLGAQDGRIVFTSGATESIQTAILSVLCALRQRQACGGDLLLYGATEHKAVAESLAHWNGLLQTGCEIRAIPVDRSGRHDLDFLRRHAERAALVCTMAANNETGVVSDLDGIARALAYAGGQARWLVDGVQALGKLPLDLSLTRIDYAAFSGHKLHAPKGTGMLYVRNGAPFTPLLAGGGQESGARSGTEGMAGIAALGAVLEALHDKTAFRDSEELRAFRSRLAAALDEAFPGLIWHAPFELSLPTTLNFSIPGLTQQELLNLFDAAGVRISGGSACSSRASSPSHVLLAMGVPLRLAESAVRLSFGVTVTAEEIDAACMRIRLCGEALRRRPVACVEHATHRAMSDGMVAHHDPELAPDMLAEFLREHPDTLLVDVREPFEHAVGGLDTGCTSLENVPLGRMDVHMASWSRDPRRPVVFFCRSGARGRIAAAWLRRLGHDHAWNLAGGVARLTRPR